MTSQAALSQRRIAIGAERFVSRATATNEPWADRNVRSWQSVMAMALAARSRILRVYLDRRASR